MCGEAKEDKDVFSASHQQQEISRHFLGSRAWAHGAVAPEDKYCNKKCPPPFFSLLLLLSRCCVMGNIPGVSCPGCPLRSCPAPLSGEEAALGLGQHCSAAGRALGCSQHLSACQGTVQHYQSSWDWNNSTSATPSSGENATVCC